MGLGRLELPTSRLSGVRSDHLSYRPGQTLRPRGVCSPRETCKKCARDAAQVSTFSVAPKGSAYWRSDGILPRKEVIQPHLPVRLPCYDFALVTSLTLGSSFLAVRSLTSGATGFHGVTGGVYKTRERIHRAMLMRDY